MALKPYWRQNAWKQLYIAAMTMNPFKTYEIRETTTLDV